MQELLARRPDVGAVFVGPDLMASAALMALWDAGLPLPGDVAVGGFDDSGLAAALDPPLTTMRNHGNASAPRWFAYSWTLSKATNPRR
jgi:DNA-binding LacI/PurR family transcriptional regulator